MTTLAKPKRPKKTRMTTREYLALPPDEHCETLLIYGELVVMPKPKPTHNRTTHFIGEMLDRWVHHMKLGMMFFDNDLILDEEKAVVHAPDLMFLLKENRHRYREELIFAPVDLAIEIVSPFERPYLQLRKFADYEVYSIPWFWVIDPKPEQPTLEELQLVNGTYVCRSEIEGDQWFKPGLFPGLTFRLPPLLEGDLKAAVKGRAKKLM